MRGGGDRRELMLRVFWGFLGGFFRKKKLLFFFHDSSPSCIFISSGDRRDENGDSNCTGSLCGDSLEGETRPSRSDHQATFGTEKNT